MGIRFACHVCAKQLNIKQELAGRRGVCPHCSTRFRIPNEDAATSTPIQPVGDAAQKTFTIKPDSKPEIRSEAIDLLDDVSDATWYVRPPSGGQYGPATTELLKDWIGEGRVAATALLWRDGWPQWRTASEALPDLADHLPVAKAGVSGVFQPPEATSSPAPMTPAPAAESNASPDLSGQPSVGSERRNRSMKRILMIGVLSALAFALVAVLVFVIKTQG